MRRSRSPYRRWSAAFAAIVLAAITAVSQASPAAAAGQPYKGLAGGSCTELTRLNTSWYYNWWIYPAADCNAPGFVPMISGSKTMTAGDVSWHLDRIVESGYKTVLGFNEPNKADQSNMTMDQVLALWPALTANSSVRVSSPSTSGDGQAWFTEFLRQADARKLRVDFINLHWYGWNAGSCEANAATFESYIRWAESLPGNRPIWITEYGCLNKSAPDRATVQRFYAGANAVFARHPRIERHAFYPYIANHELFETSGAFTPLGQAYANTPGTH